MTDKAMPRALAGYLLDYDSEYRWLVMSDPEGASQIIARDVRPDDAAYLIAGYAALSAPAGLDVELRDSVADIASRAEEYPGDVPKGVAMSWAGTLRAALTHSQESTDG